MRRFDNLIMRKLLIFLTGVFLIVGLTGCGDPVAAEAGNRTSEPDEHSRATTSAWFMCSATGFTNTSAISDTINRQD